MTKRELIKAIKDCDNVIAVVHLTPDDTFYVKVVKCDILDTLSEVDTSEWVDGEQFKAMSIKWIGDNDLLIG